MSHIFVSYSRTDKARAKQICKNLKLRGLEVWFDEQRIPPGDPWEDKIKKHIKDASLVLLLLSSEALAKDGYQQREIQIALGHMKERPEGQPYLVPAFLDEVAIQELPRALEDLHCHVCASEEDERKLVEYLHLLVFGLLPPVDHAGYSTRIREDPRLIVPGYGANSIMLGDTYDSVISFLGEPEERIGSYGLGEAFLCYYRLGVELVIEYDRVLTISLYGEGNERYNLYKGTTPEGITTCSSRREIEWVFGRPTETGGAGCVEYWCIYVRLGLGITYNTMDARDLNARPRSFSITLPRQI